MPVVDIIDAKDLPRLAWLNGYRGVTGLAKAIGRHRVTVHQAAKNPNKYKPTHRAITRALRIK